MQREGWAGTVPEQTLETGAVMGGDPHRPVQAEATGASPCEHVLGVRLGEQAAPNVEPQDPTLDSRRQSRCAVGIEMDHWLEAEWGVLCIGCAREQPVGNCTGDVTRPAG